MNEEKMIDVLAAIEGADGDLGHDQSAWFFEPDNHCGTTACLAGWTAHLAGYKPIFRRIAEYRHLDKGGYVTGTVSRDGDSYATLTAMVARAELELDHHEAHRLFYTAKSLGEVYGTAADLMGVDEQVLRDKVQDRVA